MEKKRVGIGQKILLLILSLCTLICLMPMLLVIIISFTDDASITVNGFSYFPEKLSLKGYEYVLGYGTQIIDSYKVTVFITVIGTVLALLVMSMFAYALSRKSFLIRKYLAVFMLIPMFFSGGQLASYMINTTVYGLKDSLAVLILPMCVSTMNIIILRTYIQNNVPDSLIEAAKIDGAGDFRIYWQIVLPIMPPVLAAIGFMVAVGYWNEWQGALIYIESSSKTPLQLLLVRIENNINFLLTAKNMGSTEMAAIMKEIPQESGRMAILMTVLGPIMILYPFFQKYFVKGITVGSVKG